MTKKVILFTSRKQKEDVMKDLQNLKCTKYHIISLFSPNINGMIE